MMTLPVSTLSVPELTANVTDESSKSGKVEKRNFPSPLGHNSYIVMYRITHSHVTHLCNFIIHERQMVE